MGCCTEAVQGPSNSLSTKSANRAKCIAGALRGRERMHIGLAEVDVVVVAEVGVALNLLHHRLGMRVAPQLLDHA